MNKRIKYLEFLRVICMLWVVLIHTCITAITDYPQSSNFNIYGGIMHFIVNIAHFAVPIFFMISGALFLNPQKQITYKKVLKKYVLKYCGVIIIFGWLFALLEEIFKSKVKGHYIHGLP